MKIKIKAKQLTPLYSALSSLDSYKALDSSGTSCTVACTFSGKVSWNIRKNLGILRRKVDELNELKKDVRKQHMKDIDKPNPEEVLAAQKKWDEAMEIEDEINGLLQFNQADFNLYDKDTNPTGNRIPGTILDYLEPLIREEPATEDKKPAAPKAENPAE